MARTYGVYDSELGMSERALFVLDLARFAEDLETHAAHAGRVREHFLSGVRSGVNGTPTFFVNGIRHNGTYDAATLMTALRAAA